MALAQQLFENSDNVQVNNQTSELHHLKSKSKIISLTHIIKNPENREIDMQKVSELVDSIREIGLLDDPVVKQIDNGKFMLISGEHRITACRRLAKELPEYEAIRCKIMENDEDLNYELALLDGNIHNPLSPYELMLAIGRKEEILKLKKEKGTLRNKIAAGTQLGTTQVGTYLKIYKNASPPVKEALKSNLITVEKAYKIAQLPLYDQYMALSSTRLTQEKQTEIKPEKNIFLLEVKNNLQQKLSTKVNLKNNQLQIYFANTDDLNRILELLNSLDKEL